MVKFELEEYHRNVSRKELVEDLKRVSSKLKKNSITRDEYDMYGRFHSCTLYRKFGSWFKALEKAGLKKTRNLGVTDEEYFMNLEEVWRKLGRQPHYNDMQRPISKYSAGAYEYRFVRWRNALEKFIKFINNEKLLYLGKPIRTRTKTKWKGHKTKRNVSWRLRFIVMRRDHFKCRKCGRSPAADKGVILHVDHIIPRGKGGETVLENLQTLCSVCNIGKSNL